MKNPAQAFCENSGVVIGGCCPEEALFPLKNVSGAGKAFPGQKRGQQPVHGGLSRVKLFAHGAVRQKFP